MKNIVLLGSAALLSACAIQQPARIVYVDRPVYRQAPPPPPIPVQPQPTQPFQPQGDDEYQPPAPQPVVSVYVEPPLEQPAPVLVSWAPPPMLVEIPPPMPYDGAIWTGGYWVWEGNWVWAHGRWAPPPRFGYGWVNPYYENRGGSVVFVNGFWAAPGVVFMPPPMGLSISVGVVAIGVVAGPRVMGPPGVFVPPPPGSHVGLIVPAPIGTAPAVVTGAPPIVNAGMHITGNANIAGRANFGGNVNIVAPANATANGQAFSTSVPTQPHLAAAMPPMVKAYAPMPASNKPIPAYVAGAQPAALPQAQVVHPEVAPGFKNSMHQRMLQQQPGATHMPAAAPSTSASSPVSTQPGVNPNQNQPTQAHNPPNYVPGEQSQQHINQPRSNESESAAGIPPVQTNRSAPTGQQVKPVVNPDNRRANQSNNQSANQPNDRPARKKEAKPKGEKKSDKKER